MIPCQFNFRQKLELCFTIRTGNVNIHSCLFSRKKEKTIGTNFKNCWYVLSWKFYSILPYFLLMVKHSNLAEADSPRSSSLSSPFPHPRAGDPKRPGVIAGSEGSTGSLSAASVAVMVYPKRRSLCVCENFIINYYTDLFKSVLYTHLYIPYDHPFPLTKPSKCAKDLVNNLSQDDQQKLSDLPPCVVIPPWGNMGVVFGSCLALVAHSPWIHFYWLGRHYGCCNPVLGWTLY